MPPHSGDVIVGVTRTKLNRDWTLIEFSHDLTLIEFCHSPFVRSGVTQNDLVLASMLVVSKLMVDVLNLVVAVPIRRFGLGVVPMILKSLESLGKEKDQNDCILPTGGVQGLGRLIIMEHFESICVPGRGLIESLEPSLVDKGLSRAFPS